MNRKTSKISQLTNLSGNNQNTSTNITQPVTQKSLKTPKITDNTQISTNPDNTNLLDPDNPDSIFNQPEFPYNTKKYQFTPKQLREALIEYENTVDSIDKVLIRNKVKPHSFFKIAGQYEEIRQRYDLAQRRKSRKYGEKCLNLWEKLPDQNEFYTYDREGNKCLSTAGVRYLEVKSQMMLRFAQVHETGSFVPVSKQENINKNLTFGVTVHGKIPDGFDLSQNSPVDLIDVLKQKKTG